MQPVVTHTDYPIHCQSNVTKMKHVHYAQANTVTSHHCETVTLHSQRWRDVRVRTFSRRVTNYKIGWQQPISKSLCIGWTHSVTRYSMIHKCCAPTFMRLLILRWVHVASVTVMRTSVWRVMVMGQNHASVSVNISRMGRTVRNVYRSTMMHRGDVPPPTMLTSVNVSPVYFCFFIEFEFMVHGFVLLLIYDCLYTTMEQENHVFLFWKNLAFAIVWCEFVFFYGKSISWNI